MPATELPNRQSIRMKGWDYTTPGWYFVTANTRRGKQVFGTIVNGRMVLSATGKVADECWRSIPEHFPNARLDEFVIMPDHMHGIIELVRKPPAIRPPSLGDVVGAYKAAVSRIIGRGVGRGSQLAARTIWHRNYWDVIVRDGNALAGIRRYIRDNPRNHHVVDVETPRHLGNRALMKMPKVAFLASRGETTPHGELSLKTNEAIISGFLSPMERAVFRAGLRNRRPMIWVKPWGLADSAADASLSPAIEEGRLLIVSPFSDEIDAPAGRRAAWCNQYVLAHCDRVIVGHLNPDGLLACVLSEADPDCPIDWLKSE